jgi:hypothetical protein
MRMTVLVTVLVIVTGPMIGRCADRPDLDLDAFELGRHVDDKRADVTADIE